MEEEQAGQAGEDSYEDTIRALMAGEEGAPPPSSEEQEEEVSDQDDPDPEDSPQEEPANEKLEAARREVEQQRHAARSANGRAAALQEQIAALARANTELQAKLDAASKQAVKDAGASSVEELRELYPDIAAAMDANNARIEAKLAEKEQKIADIVAQQQALVEQQQAAQYRDHVLSEQAKLSAELPEWAALAKDRNCKLWIQGQMERSPAVRKIVEENEDAIVDHVAVANLYRAYQAHKGRQPSGQNARRQKQLESAAVPGSRPSYVTGQGTGGSGYSETLKRLMKGN